MPDFGITEGPDAMVAFAIVIAVAAIAAVALVCLAVLIFWIGSLAVLVVLRAFNPSHPITDEEYD
jgi:hypothetical protein